jgi:hypothetical protein
MGKGNGEGFRVLSDEEFEALSPKERKEYFRRAIEAME